MIDLILKVTSFLKTLTVWQVVFYQIGLVCLLQLVVWTFDFFIK